MKFPSDLNAQIVPGQLPLGTPIYNVNLTFNGQTHTYVAYELSESAALNILLQAMADGYGDNWEAAEVVESE